MNKDISFSVNFDLGMMHEKQNIPIYKNLKTKIRNSIAEQYFITVDTLNKIPWFLHYEINVKQCVDELVNTYLLLDEIILLTK